MGGAVYDPVCCVMDSNIFEPMCGRILMNMGLSSVLLVYLYQCYECHNNPIVGCPYISWIYPVVCLVMIYWLPNLPRGCVPNALRCVRDGGGGDGSDTL